MKLEMVILCRDPNGTQGYWFCDEVLKELIDGDSVSES